MLKGTYPTDAEKQPFLQGSRWWLPLSGGMTIPGKIYYAPKKKDRIVLEFRLPTGKIKKFYYCKFCSDELKRTEWIFHKNFAHQHIPRRHQNKCTFCLFCKQYIFHEIFSTHQATCHKRAKGYNGAERQYKDCFKTPSAVNHTYECNLNTQLLSSPQQDILKESSNILNQSLSPYTPYKDKINVDNRYGCKTPPPLQQRGVDPLLNVHTVKKITDKTTPDALSFNVTALKLLKRQEMEENSEPIPSTYILNDKDIIQKTYMINMINSGESPKHIINTLPKNNAIPLMLNTMTNNTSIKRAVMYNTHQTIKEHNEWQERYNNLQNLPSVFKTNQESQLHQEAINQLKQFPVTGIDNDENKYLNLFNQSCMPNIKEMTLMKSNQYDHFTNLSTTPLLTETNKMIFQQGNENNLKERWEKDIVKNKEKPKSYIHKNCLEIVNFHNDKSEFPHKYIEREECTNQLSPECTKKKCHLIDPMMAMKEQTETVEVRSSTDQITDELISRTSMSKALLEQQNYEEIKNELCKTDSSDASTPIQSLNILSYSLNHDIKKFASYPSTNHCYNNTKQHGDCFTEQQSLQGNTIFSSFGYDVEKHKDMKSKTETNCTCQITDILKHKHSHTNFTLSKNNLQKTMLKTMTGEEHFATDIFWDTSNFIDCGTYCCDFLN